MSLQSEQENKKYKAHRMSVAKEFRDFADRDYIAARTLYRSECKDQFLALSCAALEKYLKSVLLYGGIKKQQGEIDSQTHDLSSLLQKCSSEMNNFGLSDESEQFINNISNYHNTRYPDFPFRAENRYILDLDNAVWELRFYAQSPDISGRITKEHIEDLKNKRGKNRGNLFINGYLEKVLKNRNNKHKTERSNLVWKNFYFGDRQKRQFPFQGGWWAKNNHMFAGGEDWQREVYSVVKEYIPVSKEVREYMQNLENQN